MCLGSTTARTTVKRKRSPTGSKRGEPGGQIWWDRSTSSLDSLSTRPSSIGRPGLGDVVEFLFRAGRFGSNAGLMSV